jgi:hypothetical protein
VRIERINNSSGTTLIELAVAIIIVGIVASLVMGFYSTISKGFWKQVSRQDVIRNVIVSKTIVNKAISSINTVTFIKNDEVEFKTITSTGGDTVGRIYFRDSVLYYNNITIIKHLSSFVLTANTSSNNKKQSFSNRQKGVLSWEAADSHNGWFAGAQEKNYDLQ